MSRNKTILLVIILLLFFSVTCHQSITTAKSINRSTIFFVGGNGQSNFSSIQEAINQANTSDKIMVYPGIYNETITIFKPLHIESIIPYQAIIRSTEEKDVIHLTADGIILDGFNISGRSYTSVTITSDNNMIQNNIFFKNPGYGLNLFTSQYNIIENNTFFSNGIRISGDIDDWTSHQITNNTLDNKPIIYKKNKHNLSISFQEIGQIILANCTGCIIKNCSISQTDVGILLGHCSFCKIENNSISQTKNAIYLSYSTNFTISFNFLNKNQYGLTILKSTHNTVRNNKIENNTKIGCEICCSSKENMIYHNIFLNNNKSAYDRFSNQWFHNKKGNYWSDYTGLDTNKNGLGDSPYLIDGNTSVDPFPLMSPSFQIIEDDTFSHQSPFASFIFIIFLFLFTCILRKKILK